MSDAAKCRCLCRRCSRARPSGCSSSSTSNSSASSAPSTSASGHALPTITLANMPSGTATVSWDPSTMSITAAIDMVGFTPSSGHAMHLHPGTCADQSQPPSVPFPTLPPTPAGSSNRARSAPGSRRHTHRVVSEHPPHPDGGTRRTHRRELHLDRVRRHPRGDAGHRTGNAAGSGAAQHEHTPQGTATLTYDSTQHTLGVEVHATGLPPGSAHAVHLHSGSCSAQGAVVHPVPDLQADDAGEATTTTTIGNVDAPPPATGWYVNVHMGPMSEILDGGAPTLLFARSSAGT